MMDAPGAKPRVDAPRKAEAEAEGTDDPWAKARASGPGEAWQPQAWTPPSKKKS